MSSNIKVQKICEYCGKEFTAKKTTTRHCSDTCAKRAYKARQREISVNKCKQDTILKKEKIPPIDMLQEKEFLTVREASVLLTCSVRRVYYLIESGDIKAANPTGRMTRIRRSEINRLFS